MNRLTPLDVKRAEFPLVWRGYEKEAVESFLATVADEMERLVGEARELSHSVGELEKGIANYRAMEHTLMDTLVTTQRATDDLRENTRLETENIRREAQIRAEQTLDAARNEAERLSIEVRRRAYQTLEDAREEARRALDLARRETDDVYHRTRERVVDLQDQIVMLVEQRDSFLSSYRAALEGQLNAIEAFIQRNSPDPGAEPANDLPRFRPEKTEAIAVLDRGLAKLAEGRDAGGIFVTNLEPDEGGETS